MKIKIVFILLAIISLTGCGYVEPKVYEYADSICVDRGGLKYINMEWDNTHQVYCNDGAMYQLEPHNGALRIRNNVIDGEIKIRKVLETTK